MEIHADVAQLVERDLAKVEVAGSSPVVRSKGMHQIPFPLYEVPASTTKPGLRAFSRQRGDLIRNPRPRRSKRTRVESSGPRNRCRFQRLFGFTGAFAPNQ